MALTRYVVCPQPSCAMRGIWRPIKAELIGPNMISWPRVHCTCLPSAEIPIAAMEDGTVTTTGARFPQQLPMDLGEMFVGELAALAEPPC